MQSKYICHNGKFLLSNTQSLDHRNRAFCYGDALFETIHCLGTQAQFLSRHWDRLEQGMKVLRMNMGEDLSLRVIERCIESLLNKNRIFKGARIRLTVYRETGGFYTPEKNEVSWIMESGTLDHEKFVLNTKGLAVDIYHEVHKPVNTLSNLKTSNALLFVLAGIFRKENLLDECLILNQYGRISESISSNIFLLKKDTIYTPPLSEGCIAGTLRRTVIEISEKLNFGLAEEPLPLSSLYDADEVFLTNAIQGIRWIGMYKDRRYYNYVSRKLTAALNEFGFDKRDNTPNYV